MLIELWGAFSAPSLVLPERILGMVLLGIYLLVLLGIIFVHRRGDIRQLSWKRWLIILGLAGLSIILSQLFPITISSDNQLPAFASTQNPEAVVAPLSFIPMLLAGFVFNPLAALIVGFSGGLGRALWQSHQVFDPFHFAIIALLAAEFIKQDFSGAIYRWLRNPILAGILAALILIPLIGVATFLYTSPDTNDLAALDLALSSSTAYRNPLIIIGFLGGLVVIVIAIGLSQVWTKYRVPRTTPRRGLNRRLLTTYFILSLGLGFLIILFGFNRALSVSTDLVVSQMAQDAQEVSSQIPGFRALRQHLLVETSRDESFLSDNSAQKEDTLSRLYRSSDYYRRVMFLESEEKINTFVPESGDLPTLSNEELSAVVKTLQTSAPYIGPAQPTEDDGYVISFIVPIMNIEGQTEGALVGHVPEISLTNFVKGLQGTFGEGLGFIVDELGQVIAHPKQNNIMKLWQPVDDDKRLITSEEDYAGIAYESIEGSTNTRQVVYYQTGPDHPWTLVITMPYQVILRQALEITGQLAWVLVSILGLTGGLLFLLGKSVSQPLEDLVEASQAIASGSLETTISTQGDDEIGRLGQSFGQMQSSLKRRLDELSLLLDVSQGVSKSININKGMPSILKGALRGTGAAGIRVVVLNPGGRQPLVFGEGPAAGSMATYDRTIMSILRQDEELILSNPDEVKTRLRINGFENQPPLAIYAQKLASHERVQGIFWLSYRQTHPFDDTELNFLRTLGGQASVLVENARLFATAEGGRRRLAAVLASTTDAVIVTDQTEKILLANPAMERFFGFNAVEAVGRPLKRMIKSTPLLNALVDDPNRPRSLELPTGDGRILYANVSPIFNNEGQAMGRVGVLHDITYLKEIDDLKSEFVATVSHDLRTPLTFMTNYASMLSVIGELDDTQEEYVDKILNGIEQMSALIDDVLDLGRLEAGVDLVLSNIRIEEILNSVAEEYQQSAWENGIELVVKTAQGLPLVMGDVSMLRLSVSNLVTNAIKYAPSSGRVYLGALVNGDELIIAVRDSGPGISANDQKRLFEKFYRVSLNNGSQVKGSGLGLALVRSIAERHGGRAWCESQLGKGSTFFIALPAN